MNAGLIKIPGWGFVTKRDLPDMACRWTPKRKLLVATMLKEGLVTMDEVTKRYALTVEEVATWNSLLESNGLKALRVTRCLTYEGRRLRKNRNRVIPVT